jgi:hypothetical protein
MSGLIVASGSRFSFVTPIKRGQKVIIEIPDAQRKELGYQSIPDNRYSAVLPNRRQKSKSPGRSAVTIGRLQCKEIQFVKHFAEYVTDRKLPSCGEENTCEKSFSVDFPRCWDE